MSRPQSPYQTAASGNGLEGQTGTDDPRRPGQNRESQGEYHFSDSSRPLFSMYLRISVEEDEKRAKDLKDDTDQLLIFCGLFSATVAALVVPSISDLQPASVPSPQDAGAITYQPSNSLVLANLFWLLSLLLSVSCALWAMMLQQWARRHLSGYSLPEEARLRAFFDDGRKNLNFRWAIACINFVLQTALLMFFLGVFMYMNNINSAIAFLSYLWLSLYTAVYICVTIDPILRPNTPVSTPISPLLVFIYRRLPHLHGLKRRSFSWGLASWAAVQFRDQSSRIDGKILEKSLKTLALRGDEDLEPFFEAIPGFCDSKVVDNPLSSLGVVGRQRLAEVLAGFWERTMISGSVSQAIKERRQVIFVKVVKAADIAIAVLRILDVSRSPEIGRALDNLYNSNFAPFARGITAGIISNAERNHGWTTLVKNELSLTEDMYREYVSYHDGDSILLANLIHITRHFLDFFCEGHDRDLPQEALWILPLLSKFSIRRTLPKLQNDFCDLWNTIVQHAPDNRVNYDPFIEILDNIRPLYIDLHPTDTLHHPAPFPLCESPDHHPNLPSDTHEVACGAIDGSSQPPTSTSPTFPSHMSSPNDVPVSQPQPEVSSPNVSASPHYPSPESQGPTIPPLSGADDTPGIADTSSDLSKDGPIDFSSPSASDGPRLNEGTTGIQTELPSPPTTIYSSPAAEANPQPSCASWP